MLTAQLLAFVLLAAGAFQRHPPVCDHPAPPQGMHYVCASGDSCNCRLVEGESEAGSDETELAPTRPHPAPFPCGSDPVRYFVAPTYPPFALRSGKQGTVIVSLSLAPEGKVTRTEIQSGDPLLTAGLDETLMAWKFVATGSPHSVSASLTFAIAAGATSTPGQVTVSGSSPLNLVITASPLRRGKSSRR